MHKLYSGYLRLPLLIRLLFIIVIILLTSAFLAHYLEPKTFPSIFEGLYWSVITAGTVGYGDFVPKATSVRIISILLVFIGGSFFTFFTVHIAASVVKNQNRLTEGKVAFMGKNHRIIAGWNERSKTTILTLKKEFPEDEVVLMDSTLTDNPLYNENVHLIKGYTYADESWEKAGLAHAHSVLITADQNKSETEADMQTIMAVLTVRGLNPHIPIISEILMPDHVQNAKRAGATSIIQTTSLASDTMVTHLSGRLQY